MSSTLIELPPELSESDEPSTVEYVDAQSVEEFAERTHIDDKDVLERVLLPGREFGPYRILGFIASGGMGEIYAAERLTDDGTARRPVALKVISPEHAHDWRIVERFKREASISKAIRSDNVIRVYEYGETDEDKAFLSMELLSGEELFERLCRVRTLPLDELTDIALQVLDGLYDIHKSGFIHRDIKPENIFLSNLNDGTEVAKILDFGIAKRREERSDPLLSVAGQIYGTPEYLAPEQAINPDVDPRADIYSMGVMLYEAATGSLPFSGDTSYSVIAAHQNEPVPPLPSSIDTAFAEIVYTALAKNPADRFQNADEMAQVLRRWKEQTSWVEELPGVGDVAFDDVFDSQDLTPSRTQTKADTTTRVSERAPTKQAGGAQEPIGLQELSDPRFYLDESAPSEEFEKFSVTKARQREQRRQQKKRSQRPADATGEMPARSPTPEGHDEQAGGQRAGAEKRRQREQPVELEARRHHLDDATETISRQKVGLDAGPTSQTRVAQVVTWLAVVIILAAIAWAMYQPDGAAEPSYDEPAAERKSGD